MSHFNTSGSHVVLTGLGWQMHTDQFLVKTMEYIDSLQESSRCYGASTPELHKIFGIKTPIDVEKLDSMIENDRVQITNYLDTHDVEEICVYPLDGCGTWHKPEMPSLSQLGIRKNNHTLSLTHGTWEEVIYYLYPFCGITVEGKQIRDLIDGKPNAIKKIYAVSGNIVERGFYNRKDQTTWEAQLDHGWWESGDLEFCTSQARLQKIALGLGVPGWILKDVNPYNYNCGHYPEYIAVKITCLEEEIDEKEYFSSKEAADKVAAYKNERASREWRVFLNA